LKLYQPVEALFLTIITHEIGESSDIGQDGSVFWPPALEPERIDGCALHHFYYSNYSAMLCDISHRIYTTGNPIVLVFTSNCILCKIQLNNNSDKPEPKMTTS
jgi:hypothetical protein